MENIRKVGGMKYYLKVFLIALILFSLLFASGFYMITRNTGVSNEDKPTIVTINNSNGEENETEIPLDERSELQRLVDSSERVNVLVFGVQDDLADTIMLMSYSPGDQLLDILSIPRDTYNPVDGHNLSGQKKINAVYGFKNDGGSLGLKNSVENLLNIPVNYYIKLKYDGVVNIVDVLDGVEINVFKHLQYDDPLSKPPLHIDIPAGKQVLNGENAIKYLRWRQNNDGVGDGDIGRIQRQQAFVIAAAKKAFSLKLPVVIKTAFNYVKTDMGLDVMLYYGTTATDFNFTNLETHRLPGTVKMIEGSSYVLHDPAKTEEMLVTIYNRVTKQ